MRVIAVSDASDEQGEKTRYTIQDKDGSILEAIKEEDGTIYVKEPKSDAEEEFVALTVMISSLTDNNSILTDGSDEEAKRYWVDFPGGRALEIVKKDGESQPWLWNVYFADNEYDEDYGCRTKGVIATRMSEFIGSAEGRENLLWAKRLAKPDYSI